MALQNEPNEPKGEQMRQIEFEIMPALQQEKPVNAVALYREFEADDSLAQQKYAYYRLDAEGIASKVQRDVHNKPSVELSDQVGGKCYVLCVFNDPGILDAVKPGEHVLIRGNYLAASSLYGIILKNSELVKRIQ